MFVLYPPSRFCLRRCLMRPTWISRTFRGPKEVLTDRDRAGEASAGAVDQVGGLGARHQVREHQVVRASRPPALERSPPRSGRAPAWHGVPTASPFASSWRMSP